MITPAIKDIISLAKSKKYPIFDNNSYKYNLNIWGIRSNNKDVTSFNDTFMIFRKYNGKWTVEYFNGTTDPSDLTLAKPENDKGTAILVPGHYTGLWAYGFHKQRKDHKALVQVRPCIVYRDNNKDKILDYKGPTDTGLFGINMHRASAYGITSNIGLYSAGCQVHSDVDRYNKVFIPLIEGSVNEGLTSFSYTLINESDL